MKHQKTMRFRNKTTGEIREISRHLFNSALVSAQNRQRYYWTNIPNVPQPEDRGILLKDVLESRVAWKEKAYCLDANYYKGGGNCGFDSQAGLRRMVAEPIDYIPRPGCEIIISDSSIRCANKNSTSTSQGYTVMFPNDKADTVSAGQAAKMKVIEPIRIGTIENEATGNHDSKQYRVYSPEGKATALCGQGGGVGAKTGLYACPIGETKDGKAFVLTASYANGSGRNIGNYAAHTIEKGCKTMVAESWDGKTYPVYEVKDGLITIKDKQYPIKLPDGDYIIRKLTVNECRRLQTIPDWYQMPCSNSQNYKMLGNGWTVEVIKHILSYIPGIADCTVEVLSMYDGMSCGQIALTELGCGIERYVSYEIDKYAIQTTYANFSNTEQRGDAFYLRSPEWAY